MSNRKIPFWKAMAGFLRLGLCHFWQQALPSDTSLLRLLQDEASALLSAQDSLNLHNLKQQITQQWPPQPSCPLSQLVLDYQLSLSDTLLLTLLGEMERSHIINLAIHQLQAPSTQHRPSVHLCAALLDSVFDQEPLQSWAITQNPLIQANLVELTGSEPLPLRQLTLPDGVWSALLQQSSLWPQCHKLEQGKPKLLPNAIQKQLPTLVEMLSSQQAKGIIIRGHPHSGRRLLAQEIAKGLSRTPLSVPTDIWQQQKALAITCHYAGWLPVLELKLNPGETWTPPPTAESSSNNPVPCILLLSSDGAVESTDYLEVVIPLPDQSQRFSLWAEYLGNEALAKQCVSTTMVSGMTIANLTDKAKLLAKGEQKELSLQHIFHARQQLGSERLRILAQPDYRQVDRKAIVLPSMVDEELERLISRAMQRETLWQGLGATLQQTFTAGVRALFIGESGTGKTLAASYIATRLGSPLYRVDLSAVMNKYVGESEKNLSAVLDMAAASDVVLLFDEADSLFGKRSEGKETGERFANMLTHFLLSRIETHPGIVLLTSNNRERIDPAFTRRLDLIVEFPTPGFQERLQLWISHLGDRGPDESVYRLLASHCDFSGGQIRNVVLSAAVCAQQGKISAHHLLTGLQAEYRKLGRDIPHKLQQLSRLEQNSLHNPKSKEQV